MDDGSKAKKGAKKGAETKMEDFTKLDMELDPVRAETSYQLRQKQYTDTVKQLINALDNASADLEVDGDKSQNIY